MSRELFRVPLDFEWPTNVRWKGYLDPHYDKCHQCEACGGTGYSPVAKMLHTRWWSHMDGGFRPEENGCIPHKHSDPLAVAWAKRQCERSPEYYGTGTYAEEKEARRITDIWNGGWQKNISDVEARHLYERDQLRDFTRRWGPDGWTEVEIDRAPTGRELSEYLIQSTFSDSGFEWNLIKFRCAQLGLPVQCKVCKGEGSIWESPLDEYLSETWEREDPPRGEGYQLWETVTEGSPITPVFDTPEKLAQYMAIHPNERYRDGLSYERWLKFIMGPGWAPSGGSINGVFLTGVEYVTQD